MTTRRTALPGVLAAFLLLGACGASDTGETDPGSANAGASTKRLSVVASTNVWGSVVTAVGGEDVTVSSIISDPAQDPHSFEANTNTLLMLSKADLVIENGGGYDDFMDRMHEASSSEAPVLNAVDISGKTAPEGAELNEHVWYDLPTVTKVADAVAVSLGRADPAGAEDFTTRATAFKARVDRLAAEEAGLKGRFGGDRIGITEPVPLYLTEACGLTNATPEEFSEAIEEGDDVSPAVLKSTLDLYTDGSVDALVYNEQTSGPVTERVQAAAQDSGIPVVPVTETLPSGVDYVDWMKANLSRLEAALARA